MLGKKYENLRTGEISEVRLVEDGIAHLSNDTRVITSQLENTNLYSEKIDINSFENSFHNSLAANIMSLNTDNMSDNTSDSGGVDIKMVNPVESHSEAQMRLQNNQNKLSDAELDELDRRKKEMLDNANNMNSNVNSQKNKFNKYFDEDEINSNVNVNKNLEGVVQDSYKRPDTKDVQDIHSEVKKTNKFEDTSIKSLQNDPIYAMFSNVKRNVNFKINLPINEKIPTKEFIKMWEDNYEKSIIDFLTDEFVNNIINDPDKIRDIIRESIRDKVYSKPKPRKKTN